METSESGSKFSLEEIRLNAHTYRSGTERVNYDKDGIPWASGLVYYLSVIGVLKPAS